MRLTLYTPISQSERSNYDSEFFFSGGNRLVASFCCKVMMFIMSVAISACRAMAKSSYSSHAPLMLMSLQG